MMMFEALQCGSGDDHLSQEAEVQKGRDAGVRGIINVKRVLNSSDAAHLLMKGQSMPCRCCASSNSGQQQMWRAEQQVHIPSWYRNPQRPFFCMTLTATSRRWSGFSLESCRQRPR
jgi:hypothetical protein